MNTKNAYTVTIVEDNAVYSDWLKTQIQAESHIQILDSCTSGRQALAALRKQQPDILLLDFQLSDMTALGLVKKIKIYYPKLKVFLLTAHQHPNIIYRLCYNKHIQAIGLKQSTYLSHHLIQALDTLAEQGSFIDPSLLLKLRADQAPLDKFTSPELEIFLQTQKKQSDKTMASNLNVKITHIRNVKCKLKKKLPKGEALKNLLATVSVG